MFIVVFKSLLAQYHIQMERQSGTLLAVQVIIFKEKVRRQKKWRRRIQLHRIWTVIEFVAQGDRDVVLEFLRPLPKARMS